MGTRWGFLLVEVCYASRADIQCIHLPRPRSERRVSLCPVANAPVSPSQEPFTVVRTSSCLTIRCLQSSKRVLWLFHETALFR